MHTHNVHQKRIDRYTTLSVVEIHGVPSNIIGVLFHVGSRHDPLEKRGLTHLCEHLFMRRTHTFPNAFDRLRALERVHVDFSAFTSRETVLFVYEQIVQSTQHALDLLIDGLAHTIYSAADVRREQNIILQEMRENESDIDQYRFGLGARALWDGNTLASNIMGTPATLKHITLQDVTKHMQQYFTPRNAHYLFVGGGYFDDVLTALRSYHEVCGSNGDTGNAQEGSGALYKTVTPRIHVQTDRFGTDIVHVGVYIRTCSIHHVKDRVVLALIRNHLAGSWTSCLISELRIARDMVYWINADTGYFSDTGYLELTYAVHPKHFAESVHIIIDNVYRIAERGISEENLRLQSEGIIAGLQQESINVSSMFGWYMDDAAHGLPLEPIQIFAEKIRAIRPEDTREVAQRYFQPDNIAIISVGNLSL